MPTPQTYKNHTRFDPVFHFFLVQVFLLNILLAIYLIYRDWPAYSRLHLWNLVMAIALFLLTGTMRKYAAQNQDRIIRLEERLRIAALLPPTQAAAAQALTTKQLVALRFASDLELPALIQRTLTENLSPSNIKKSIAEWRPDYQRI